MPGFRSGKGRRGSELGAEARIHLFEQRERELEVRRRVNRGERGGEGNVRACWFGHRDVLLLNLSGSSIGEAPVSGMGGSNAR